jgi:hypothetical protein
MRGAVTFDEACATCATKTGMSKDDWADFLSLPPESQSAAAEAYRNTSWVKSASVLADVIAVLIVAGQVAGAVSGITGAVSALQALRV